MIVDLSRCNLLLGVSFHSGEHTGVVYCDYAGVIESCGSEMIVMGADGSPIRFCAPCSNYKNSKEESNE